MVKSGWFYDVWGASEDPDTWLEQNITLLKEGKSPPQRKLNRREELKEREQIVEEIKKSKALAMRHGQQFIDFPIQNSEGQSIIGDRD